MTRPGSRTPFRARFRRLSALLAGAVAAGFIGSLVLASNTSYPEMGGPVGKKKAAEMKPLIQCALDSLNQKYKDKLKHCNACDVEVRSLNTGKIKHWKHGNEMEEEFNPPAFTPEATPEQLKKCDLCLGINMGSFCGFSDPYKKRIFKHELAHLTQYNFWGDIYTPNEELFNHPFDENNDGKADGENGNPKKENGFVPDRQPVDDTHDADMKTRALFDKFESLRTEMTELEATLADLDDGCTTDKALGDWWLKPHTKKKEEDGGGGEEVTCPPRLCDTKGKLDDCKMKLQMMIDSALMETGPAYDKLKKFAMRLNNNMPMMCKDIDAAKAEIDAAKMKYCQNGILGS